MYKDFYVPVTTSEIITDKTVTSSTSESELIGDCVRYITQGLRKGTQQEEASVPDLYSTSPLDFSGGTFGSAHEMDPYPDDTTWSRYEIDCALQSQEFYSAYSEEKMSKIEKVRFNFTSNSNLIKMSNIPI